MFKKVFSSHSLLAPNLDSFRRQESIFISLNLLILLGFFRCIFTSLHSGAQPPRCWFSLFGSVSSRKSAEWLWLRRLSRPLTPFALAALTWSSIALNIALTSLLAILTDKEDTPYFVLMVVAVLEAAFRFQLVAILAVVTVVDISFFMQVWWFFKRPSSARCRRILRSRHRLASVFYRGHACLAAAWRTCAARTLRLASNVLELDRDTRATAEGGETGCCGTSLERDCT